MDTMNTNDTVEAFADKIGRARHMTLGDARHLRRHVLPDGIASREEVRILLRLDDLLESSDPAWSRWLASAIAAFVIRREQPAGIVSEDTARWLAALLTGNCAQAPARSTRPVIRAIVQHAQAFENDALFALSQAARPRRAPARSKQTGALRAAA